MSATKQIQLKIRRVREVVEEATIVVEMPTDMQLADIGEHYNRHLPSGTVTLPPGTTWSKVRTSFRDEDVAEIVNLSAST